MEKPTISNTGAVFQAGATIGTYLSQAIEEIDKRLGHGYAERHPELIAECVRSQTLDFNGVSLSAALHELREGLHEISTALEE
jgi:hypothetical protein